MNQGLQLWIIFLVLVTVSSTTKANSGVWSEWSVCSQSCGGGTQTRNRTCAGCVETRTCNDRTCRIGTTAMVGVAVGVSVTITTIIIVVLVGIFFVKEKNEKSRRAKSVHKSSVVESTPGASRRTRTGTVDSNLDIKLNVIRQDNASPAERGRVCMVTST